MRASGARVGKVGRGIVETCFRSGGSHKCAHMDKFKTAVVAILAGQTLLLLMILLRLPPPPPTRADMLRAGSKMPALLQRCPLVYVADGEISIDGTVDVNSPSSITIDSDDPVNVRVVR